jgi:type IV pilus assembly protein PilC
MRFQYRAYDSNGGIATGVLEGSSDHDAIEKLGEKNLLVVSLEVAAPEIRGKNARIRIPLDRLTSATRELATMIRAGLPLLRSLVALERQVDHRDLQLVLRELGRSVEGGLSFSDSLRLYPQVFSRVYIAMVTAGESSGLLAEVLDRIASYLEMSLSLRRRIRSAMMYPILVGTVGVGICIFMTTKIIPVFADIFKEFDHQLPLPTIILLNVSAYIRVHLLACMATGFATGMALWYMGRTTAGRELGDRLKTRLPVVGPLARKIAFTRFARTVAFTLHSGVPILKALDIGATAACSIEFEATIRQVRDNVEDGLTLHDAMVRQQKFPSVMLEMVGAGEETGTVDELLTQVADHYDREIDATLSGLTAILEPLLILLLGIVVGGVVVAMFLPIFKMTEAIQF